MLARVTPREAQVQLNRLIAVFPRHGLSPEGIFEYAEIMANFFAGEWHMRKVIEAAMEEFRYFPNLAELRDLTDRVSAERAATVGCPNCIRSMPGRAYQTALWTPGSDGKRGRLEALSAEAAEQIRPQLQAAIDHAKQRGLTYDGQRIIETTDPAAAVGYCDCQAGVMLRERSRAQHAVEAERREERAGMRRAGK